jgi:hypothetical protein
VNFIIDHQVFCSEAGDESNGGQAAMAMAARRRFPHVALGATRGQASLFSSSPRGYARLQTTVQQCVLQSLISRRLGKFVVNPNRIVNKQQLIVGTDFDRSEYLSC